MNLLQNMKVLSDDEMYLIHMRVMETLEQIGIMVEEEASLKVLEQNGAKINYDTKRAYLPPELIQHCLTVKGHSFTLYDSFGKRSTPMGGNIVNYAPLGYSTTYVDTDGVCKPGTYDALLRESKYVDVIDEVNTMHPSIQPCDKPAPLQDMYMVKAMLVGTRKPIHCVANSEKTAEGIIRLHAEVAGGLDNIIKKPRHMFNLCTFSPLGIRKDCCEVIRQAAKYNVPCMFSTGTMAGATAPVTLAGSMVESLAEVIGHIVLAQVQKPGLPVAMLHASRIFDMRYAACTVATPEYMVMKVAACQMAEYYKIPIGAIALCSDSNDFDVQYGWEKFASSFIPRQAKMNMIFGMGMYSQLNQFGFAGLAIDAEIIRVVERIARGMEVNEATLCFDILEAEAEKANFLYHPHTINNYKTEFMTPILSDRAPYTTFTKREGKNSMIDRAIKQLEKYEKMYDYTKGLEKEETLQKIIDEYK